MPIKDYRLVFDVIDYDQEVEVNFLKFCLINTDKSKNIFGQIDEINRLKEMHEEMDEKENLKERYDYLI